MAKSVYADKKIFTVTPDRRGGGDLFRSPSAPSNWPPPHQTGSRARRSGRHPRFIGWNNQKPRWAYIAFPAWEPLLHTLNFRLFPEQSSLPFHQPPPATKVISWTARWCPCWPRCATRSPRSKHIVVERCRDPAVCSGVRRSTPRRCSQHRKRRDSSGPNWTNTRQPFSCYSLGNDRRPQGRAVLAPLHPGYTPMSLDYGLIQSGQRTRPGLAHRWPMFHVQRLGDRSSRPFSAVPS